ncbi:hypothetical protein Tco_1100518 [Tanacetum coccineum]
MNSPFGSSVFLNDSSDFTKSSTLFIISVTVFGTWSKKRLANSGNFELLMKDDICMTMEHLRRRMVFATLRLRMLEFPRPSKRTFPQRLLASPSNCRYTHSVNDRTILWPVRQGFAGTSGTIRAFPILTGLQPPQSG